MAYEHLDYVVRDGVAVITLRRPEASNALNIALTRELWRAVTDADEECSVRCILLTGTGKAFCGGGDVKSFAAAATRAPLVLKELTGYLHSAISRLCRASKPVITAVNGVAAGAGMSLAIIGDLVLAAESARFIPAYVKIGAVPDGSFTYFLPRIIGVRRTFDLYYNNRVLSAAEALTWGLVTSVQPDAGFADGAERVARDIAAGPTFAFGRARQLIQHSFQESLETQMELEAQAIADCGTTSDFQSAVAAFKTQRRTRFEGR